MTGHSPGVHSMPAADYHADPCETPSLTSSLARRLIATCPATVRWELDHPPKPSAAMEFGTAAHNMMLERGDRLRVVDAASWRSAAAAREKDAAENAGEIPVLASDYQTLERMRAAFQVHELAQAAVSRGTPEQTLIWRCEETCILKRSRIDWLPEEPTDRYVVDYKTARSVHPDDLRKSMLTYGLHQQAAYYLEGVEALAVVEEPVLVFVFQATAAPHPIVVACPDESALRWGHELNARASRLWRDCHEVDDWPGYTDDIVPLSLPGWAVRKYEKGEWA